MQNFKYNQLCQKVDREYRNRTPVRLFSPVLYKELTHDTEDHNCR